MKSLSDMINESLGAQPSTDVKKVQQLLKADAEYNARKGNCELWYNVYDRVGTELRIMKFDAKNELDAIKQMIEKINLYMDASTLDIVKDGFEYEGDPMTAEQVIEQIVESNGDGCDYIHYFAFKNKALIDEIADPYNLRALIKDEVYTIV